MADTYKEESTFISNIKGVEIKLTPEILGKILNLLTEGVDLYVPNWYVVVQISTRDLIKEMFLPIENDIDHISSKLKISYKLIHNMCQFSLLPRSGSKHSVSETDMMPMYHM
jgi:hypothetical protein